MKEAVIKIEIKVVVEREECGNDGFHTEEKSRDENGDKSLEIDLVKVAIIDLFAKNGLSFDEIEAVLYPDSSFEDVFGLVIPRHSLRTASLKSLIGSTRRSFRMKTGITILYELFFKSS